MNLAAMLLPDLVAYYRQRHDERALDEIARRCAEENAVYRAMVSRG